MIAVLMPFNTKLLQVKHLLVLWGLFTLVDAVVKIFTAQVCHSFLETLGTKTEKHLTYIGKDK